MLLIFTDSVSNRLKYIANLMVRHMLGTAIEFTTSREEYACFTGAKICYSREPASDGIFIEAAGLLFENTLVPHPVTSSVVGGTPVLFTSSHPLSGLPFDPFAASFYMVSRYEEYHPHKKDNFGRFPATESIAWKGEFLDVPVVHHWTAMLEKLLKQKYPGFKTTHQSYRYVPTIDVDHAWCYRGRNFARTMGGFGRSLIHGRIGEIAGRFKTLARLSPDPYDNYAYISGVHEPFADIPLYFILFADYGRNDNNVTVSSGKFQRLVRDLDRRGNVGIHPSLSSNKYQVKLEDELDGLCQVLGRDVTISRQHFLKLSLPKTYRILMQYGITDDYSMGYAANPGFRAGIATPFPFFDVLRDESTPLMIHPVTLMDVTMKDYLRLSREESLRQISSMIQTIRGVNGEFVSLWHNESLGNTGRWEGWRSVYEEMVKLAST